MVNSLALAFYVAMAWLAVDCIRYYWPGMKRVLKLDGDAIFRASIVVGFALPAISNGAWWSMHFIADAVGWESIRALTHAEGQLSNIFTRYVPYIAVCWGHLAGAWLFKVTGIAHPGYYVARTLIVTAVMFVVFEWLIAGAVMEIEQ